MKRIQRQRTKGWRMPEDAVYVGRPSPWGNPWRIEDDAMPWLAVLLGLYGNRDGCREAAVQIHRAWITDSLPLKAPGAGIATAFAANAAAMYLDGMDWPDKPDLAPLRGKNLVCWCPLEDEHGNRVPCHADVLLELANR